MDIAIMIMMVLLGLYLIGGAIFNWDFFYESYKVRRIVDVLGRNGARIFYALFGVFFLFCGIIFAVTMS